MLRRLGIVMLLTMIPHVAYADHAININTADKTALMSLSGIGEVKAQAIIDYRASNTFDTPEEIMDVSGIGTATYNGIKDHITVGSSVSTQQTQTVTSTSTAQTATAPSQQTQSTPSATVPSYVPPPEPILYADAGSDRTVIVGADSEFRGRAYNKAKETVSGARLNWNFGDGTLREGASVMHHFDYPGTYAVVLTVAQHLDAASDRIVVKAEPAQLAFHVHPDGSISIDNRAERDLDISRWIVSAFNRDFTMPADTQILSGASMRISPQTLGFFAGPEAVLKYPNGVVALRANQASAPQASATAPPQPTASSVSPARTAAARSVPAATAERAEAEKEAPVVQLSIAEAAAAAGGASYGGLWWLGVLALAGLTAFCVVVVRRFRGAEWDIIEDKG